MPKIENGPKKLNDILESTFSSCVEDGGTDEACSAIAWGAAKKAGWHKNTKGDWVHTKKSLFSNILKDEKEIDKSLEIQTLIFSKNKFSKEDALKWAKDHKFKSDTSRENAKSIRVRQTSPDEFDQNSFVTIKLTDGVSAIMGKLLIQKSTTKNESIFKGII